MGSNGVPIWVIGLLTYLLSLPTLQVDLHAFAGRCLRTCQNFWLLVGGRSLQTLQEGSLLLQAVPGDCDVGR